MFYDEIFEIIDCSDPTHTVVSILGKPVSCEEAMLDRTFFKDTDTTTPMLIVFTGKTHTYEIRVDFREAVIKAFALGELDPTIQRFTSEDEFRLALQDALGKTLSVIDSRS